MGKIFLMYSPATLEVKRISVSIRAINSRESSSPDHTTVALQCLLMEREAGRSTKLSCGAIS